MSRIRLVYGSLGGQVAEVTQVEYVSRLIELGCFDFFGMGTDKAAAWAALETAVRTDALMPPDLT